MSSEPFSFVSEWTWKLVVNAIKPILVGMVCLIALLPASAEEKIDEKALVDMVKELSKGLPREVESGVQMDSVVMSWPDRLLLYNYTMLNPDATTIPEVGWEDAELLAREAYYSGATKALRTSGVTIVYLYRGKDGAPIREISLRPRDPLPNIGIGTANDAQAEVISEAQLAAFVAGSKPTSSYDKRTRISKGPGMTIIYHYTFTDMKKADMKDLIAEQRTSLVRQYRKSAGAATFRVSKVTFIHDYSDMDGVPVAKIVVGPEDLKPPVGPKAPTPGAGAAKPR